MFADSGCCVPYENMLRGLDMLKSGGCDIAHGSRKLEQTRIIRDQGLYRHVCSKLFHWFVILFMRVPAELTDTQCGFKVYKGDVARELYGECITDGFAFDVEIILRALREGYRIKEFALEWSCDRDSRLSPGRSVWRILGELLAIRRALRG
jgi:dolichyl-phosphate beta-glucosyltransferase